MSWPDSQLINYLFVAVTAFIAWHGINYRDSNGEREWGHLIFGCIALLFCLRVLLIDILGVKF